MKRLFLLMTFLFGLAVMQSCSNNDNTLIDDEIEQQKIENETEGQGIRATKHGSTTGPK